MEILLKRNKLADTVLSPQQLTSDGSKGDLRLCSYVQQIDTDGGVLLYHLVTGELVRVGDIKTDEKELFSKFFLVSNEHDDYRMYQQFMTLYNALTLRYSKKISHFTVLTTTDCNARCFYCYEKGMKKEKMSSETAKRTAEYIRDNADTSVPVKLWWLGGEPLYNDSVIDSICSDLREAGIEYYSTMTSNGYLFDDASVAKAKEFWKLKKVQITLDGTEEIYNRRKAYIYREDGSPFRRVLQNIVSLSDAGIEVDIRLNLDSDNADNLTELVPQLKTVLQDRDNIFVYCHELFQCSEDDSVSEMKNYVNRVIEGCGFKNRRMFRLGIKSCNCMADSMNNIAIMPDGSLQTCTDFTGEKSFGTIWNNDNKKQAVSYYRERIIEEQCKTCPVLPVCIKLKHCPHARHGCSEDIVSRKLADIREAMTAFDSSVVQEAGTEKTW